MRNSKRHIMVAGPLGAPSTISRVQSKTRRGEIEPSAHTSKLFGEWQQRGPETFSGQVIGKLRLTLAPPQSVAVANARLQEDQP